MEVGENERNKLPEQVPYIPITPLKPIHQNLEPIWTPVEGNQLPFHGSLEPAPGAETNNLADHQSQPAPLVHDNGGFSVPLTVPDFASSSDSIAEMLSQAEALLLYSNATHDEFLNQFLPSYSEFPQLIPSSSSLGQQQHVPVQQPLVNPIHDQYQHIPADTSYFDYYGNAFLEIAPPTDNAITAEARQDAVTQTTMGEMDQEEGEENVPTTELHDPVTEVAAASTREENHNHRLEVIHDVDTNETPLTRRRGRNRNHRLEVIDDVDDETPLKGGGIRRRKKHRPRVVSETKPKTTKKQVTTKPSRFKATSTPQTEVAGESTKPFMPESANNPRKRRLNFDEGKQPDNSACRENATNFGRDISVVVEETQGLNHCVSLQYTDIGSSSGWSTGSGLHVGGSKRKQSSIQQAHTSRINLVGAQYNALPAYFQNSCVQFPNVQKKRRSEKGRNTSYKITPTERAIHDKPQPFEPNLSLGQRTPSKRKPKMPSKLKEFALMPIIRNSDARLAHTAKQTCNSDRPQTCIDALAAEVGASLTKKKRTRKRSIPVSSAYSCRNEMKQRHEVPSHNSLGFTYEENRKCIYTVDALIEQFRRLSIYREASELVSHDQNMLIPYNQDGTIVPHQAPLSPKKKQPRPKVDLDEETDKVWKLLLLDINSHGVDGTDEDKAKWWEQERNVFRGRADSFIARMHLVQGDRRFSPWKGSVVDSVVGVFLTQNVSDHLSSSAFMSLVARFPLRSGSQYKTCHKESTNLIIKEPPVCIVELEENIKLDEKISDQSVCELNSMTTNITDLSVEREATKSDDSCRTTRSLSGLREESNSKLVESAERHSREHSPVESGAISTVTGDGQENLCHGSIKKDLTGVFSSQYFADTSQISRGFSIDQNPEKIGLFSDSNSETGDLSDAARYNIDYNQTSFTELLEMADSTMLHEVYCQNSLEASLANDYTLKMSTNHEILEVNCYDPLKMEVLSSCSSKDKDEDDKGSNCPTESDNQAAIAHSQGQSQDPMQKAKELDFGDHNYAMRNEHNKIDSAPVKSGKGKEKETKKGKGKGKGKQKEKETKKGKGKGKGKQKETKKGKGKNVFDWDSLRIQAQAKAGKREKTEDTMDSLDWDAVRCADVNEIADIIKERGMNNMLAQRIKDFLNLLVDKHGGAIDLEWLRDVPPDQAKEYLLSINGLGLKSVECVRLLTLHHLAFPVDTNVGRIAVRLGWVPLQPLPESLQLHLLELYPILESIQKYLWPRLCKLDQRTLYELHYQLITFGKVFCTKSKPNCNACPMRGECRHFASAFASARLALPGPEQKNIVIATGNNATEQSPSVVINQLPLLLPGNTNQAELQQTEVIRQLEAKSEINTSQPIIEEPRSPEPACSHVSEIDVEDFDYEIPTINLDMEVFTLNLKNYMQRNMELQEGEMSKALVALNPEVAQIPAPKLKTVSRLRTEHYVYELPDSHPLLEGWDKREADDPGKYLLAIWTPGETADSIQPPERKCSFQDCDQLCDEKECFSCNNYREANSQIVRGTILIPCRTAMRGSFPLNGTYFQVNEVFADNDSSVNPISVPRGWIWDLTRRTVYFGTSVTSIFRGLSTPTIQQCFWKGFVCVRGFDRKTRAPRPLLARLHISNSKIPKNKVPKSRVPKKKGKGKRRSKQTHED